MALITQIGVAALCLSLIAMPADAAHRSKKKKPEDPATTALAEAVKDQPMTLVVSLKNQTVDVYRGTTLLTSSHVSTGRPGHTTKSGIFSVLQKQRHHYSNMYGGAPMPWMQRITWSGTALHAGYAPNYPASHGCIRLPRAFAPKLWGMTEVGDRVVVSRADPKPEIIDNPNLFQPMPMPSPPLVSKNGPEHKAELRSNRRSDMAAAASPLILAKAEMGSGKTETASDEIGDDPSIVPASAPAVPSEPSAETSSAAHAVAVTPEKADPQPVHAIDAQSFDSGPHAIDPTQTADRFAAKPAANGSHGIDLASTTPRAHADSQTADAMPNVDHAVQPPRPPSKAAKSADAGADAAAIAAAEPKNSAPLQILITKATRRDRVMGAQYQLKDLGYLPPQRFDGTFGMETIRAIRAFQKDHDMPVTGALTDTVLQKIYAVNGKTHPMDGHLYVRRNFKRVFNAAISFKDPDQPLGTNLYTVLHFSPGDTKAQWIVVSNDVARANDALNRIEVPEKLRDWISQRLTPGSSLIIADTSIDTAALRNGSDYVVLAKDSGVPAFKGHVRPQPQPRYQQPQWQRDRRRGGFWFRF